MPVECAPRSALTDLPGSTLAKEIEDTDLRALADFDLIEALRAADRMSAWAVALELAVMSELDRRRIAEAKARGSSEQLAAEFVIDELATALRLTDSAAAIRAAVAQMTAVEEQILDAAERCTVGRLRPLLRKAVAAVAPEQNERRTKDAEDSRRVEVWPTPDGTVDLYGRDLPEVDAHAAYNRLTALARARKSDGDARPLDQIRADLFVQTLRGIIPSTPPTPPLPAKLANQHDPKMAKPTPSRQTPHDTDTDICAHACARFHACASTDTGTDGAHAACDARAGAGEGAGACVGTAAVSYPASAAQPAAPKPANDTKRGVSKSASRTRCDCAGGDAPTADTAAHIAAQARGELAAALAGSPAGKRALLAAEAGEPLIQDDP